MTKKINIRPILLGCLVIFIFAEIVIFSPASVEEMYAPPASGVDPDAFIEQPKKSLIPGLPQNRIPEDIIEQFNYVSSEGTQKLWNMTADQAVLYRGEKLVHAVRIKAHLFDSYGNITTVTGKEAKYFMDKKDLEIYGDVHTKFSDGFSLVSEYLRYLPQVKKVEIPTHYNVSGEGNPPEKSGSILKFKSNGFLYKMGDSQILLPENVKVAFERADQVTTMDNPTNIESDHCVILRNKQIAKFTMNPDPHRFVKITQPGLHSQSRNVDFNYGAKDKTLHYLIMKDDVLIRDTGNKNVLKYGTAGQANFDQKKEIIVLTLFPQVYQGNDTVVGDQIILHRRKDLVEIVNSNAFSQGEPEKN
jgi:LPS export ABC transporter protein LptC